MVHWPSDPPVHIERVLDLDRGDSHALSALSMGSHTGTHVDAPRHFLSQGASVDQVPPETLIGRARVIEIQDRESIRPEELLRYGIRGGERLLFKTANSSRVWRLDRFIEDYVFLSAEAASLVAKRKGRLVGIDYLSVGGFKRDGGLVHRLLLEAGVWIVEGLDLSGVEPGKYDLVCLPIKISGGDGAPARAMLRPARG